MGYLDDLNAIFGTDDISTDVIDVDASPVDGSVLGTARRQLNETRSGYHEAELDDGAVSFTACGSRFGCGYAEGVAVVDPETGEASVVVNTNLHVSPQNIKGMRKLFRRLNQEFIIPGLEVDDDGLVCFRAQKPCNVKEGDDLGEYLGKGFSTVHAHAHMVAQVEAGRAPWDILNAE